MQDVVDSISYFLVTVVSILTLPSKCKIHIVYEWNAMANIRFFIIIVIMTDRSMFT